MTIVAVLMGGGGGLTTSYRAVKLFISTAMSSLRKEDFIFRLSQNCGAENGACEGETCLHVRCQTVTKLDAKCYLRCLIQQNYYKLYHKMLKQQCVLLAERLVVVCWSVALSSIFDYAT